MAPGQEGWSVANHSFLSPRAPDRRSVFSASRRSANASSRPLGRYNTTVCRATDHGVENRGREHCHANHAEEHYRAQSLSHLGARAVAIISGITPKMNAKPVMRVGRRRSRAASMAASAACLLSRSAWNGRGPILNKQVSRVNNRKKRHHRYDDGRHPSKAAQQNAIHPGSLGCPLAGSSPSGQSVMVVIRRVFKPAWRHRVRRKVQLLPRPPYGKSRGFRNATDNNIATARRIRGESSWLIG